MTMTLDKLLKECTVRINTGTSQGTGFFVGPGYVLTCAHVVEAAYNTKTPIQVYWHEQCCNVAVKDKDIRLEKYVQRSMGLKVSHLFPDLALLPVTFSDHPCVILSDDPISLENRVRLLSCGYTARFPNGTTSIFEYAGGAWIENEKPLLNLTLGEAPRGFSGAPLLNLSTHRVCGVVEISLDPNSSLLGGRAIPASTVFETFPQVKKFQEEYLSRENPWQDLPPLKEHFWYVTSSRNRFFTGRRDVFAHLRTELTKESPLPQAINGLSGIGKTQIALEYAYRYGLEYQAVFWVKSDPYPTLVSDFVNIAKELNLPEKNNQDQSRIIDAVKSWLQHHHNWLLIFDNVKHEDLEWMSNFCPQGRGHHILLTTRTQLVEGYANSIEIEKMGPQEGVLLLLRRSGILAPDDPIDRATEDDRIDAAKIVIEMDGLPLALEQAAAYIKQNKCQLSDYLDLYRKHRKELFPSSTEGQESVTTTWSLSFQLVEQRSAAAADLLRFCTFLNPDAIPVDLIIVEGALDLGPVLQPIAADTIKLNKAIEELRKFSLVRYHANTTTRTLTIHRLVQHVLKDSMSKDTQRIWIQRTVRVLNRAFPEVEFKEWSKCQQCLPHVLTCLPLIKQEEITSLYVTQLLNKAGSYLLDRAQFAQAMELIEQALTSRKSMLRLEEADEATSLHNMALLYFKQGRYGDSEPYYLNALAIRKKALGQRHPDTATSLDDLAGLYYCQGQYAQAEKLCQQGLKIRKRVLGLEHTDTAHSLDELGSIYYKQGKYDQAEKLFLQARGIREKLLGHEDPDTATSINNLARLYYSKGKYKDAEPFYQMALDIRKKVLGLDHPDTANSLNDLARLYYRLARYDQAEPLYQQARDAWTRILGSNPMHPDLATVYNNIAKLYYRLGDYTQAKKCYLEALNIRQQTLSRKHNSIVMILRDLAGAIVLPEHPDVATTLNDLGRLYYSQGIYVEAEKLYQPALTMREKLLDPEHSDIAESLNNLGSLYYKQGKYVQAEKFYQKALEIRQNALGPGHPDAAETLNNLGRLYYRLGQYDKAKDYYQKALAIREKVLELKHPDSATTLNYLAKLYSKQGKFTQAEHLYQQAQMAWEKLKEKKLLGFGLSPDMAAILHDLATFYIEIGDFAQAEPLNQQSLEIRMQVLGSESPDTASSYHNMGLLYYQQGNYEQAEERYQWALEIRKNVLGPEHPAVATTLNSLARLYYSQGKYAQAEQLYHQALEIREKALGPEHPYIADSLNNLGRLYYRQARYTQAEELCQRALEIRKNVLGLDHPDTTISITDLAWIYTYLGNYGQAEKLYQQSLTIREKVLPPEHPYIADSLNDLAKFYSEMGDYTQAESLYQRALAIRENALGPQHPKVAETLNDQANLYVKQGRYEQAELIKQLALSIQQKALPQEHPSTAAT